MRPSFWPIAVLLAVSSPTATVLACAVSGASLVCSIDTARNPRALCNDGSIPAFWYRPSPNQSSTWIIWLEGGGDCDDNASCSRRATSTPRLVSAAGFHAGSGAGILSASAVENPKLYDANTVLVHYCSSDTWSGQKPGAGAFDPAQAATTWAFQGRAIAQAAVQTLPEIAPAFTTATRIIIGGDSAGGEGATIAFNDLQKLLPPAAQSLLVNDAGFALNIGQYAPNAPSPHVSQASPNAFERGIEARLKFWLARGDKICDAAARTTLQHGACYDSAYVLQNGYIRAPSFVAESQLDLAQVTLELCPALNGSCAVSHTATDPTAIFATAFAAQMRATMIGAGTGAAYVPFSPDQYMHVILASALFTTPIAFPIGVRTPQFALDTWLANLGRRPIYAATGPGVTAPSLSSTGKR